MSEGAKLVGYPAKAPQGLKGWQIRKMMEHFEWFYHEATGLHMEPCDMADATRRLKEGTWTRRSVYLAFSDMLHRGQRLRGPWCFAVSELDRLFTEKEAALAEAAAKKRRHRRREEAMG